MPPLRVPASTRIVSFGLGLVTGQIVSFASAALRFPDTAIGVRVAIGVAGGVVAGVLFDRVFTVQILDLRTARCGSAEQRRTQLRQPVSQGHEPMRAAIAIEEGELTLAASLLDRVTGLPRFQPCLPLVQARYALATGDPASCARALDQIVRWRRPGIGPFIAELKRYRAFVIARAIATGDSHSSTKDSAASDLLAARDLDVRAYGTWLALGDADALTAIDPATLARGAALARAAGLATTATTVEAAVAARAARGLTGPYRG